VEPAFNRKLDGDGCIEIDVPGFPDLTHSTLPNETNQLVAPCNE
jgi:hypothetical protein